MRVQHRAVDKHKNEATDQAKLKKAPIPAEDRGFGAFGAILISFVLALLGTASIAVLYDISWVWWLPIFIIFGVTTMAALMGSVYLKEK
ncbi:MAG: hypothetical protein AAF636_26500 [Pseudomonadota bacterium]